MKRREEASKDKQIQSLSKAEKRMGSARPLLRLALRFSVQLRDAFQRLGIMKRFAFEQNGFTLIELMIAVGIIAIAAAIATPSYLQWLAKSQLRQATTEIARQMTLARMAGMNQNRSVDVTVQNTGGQIHISAVTSSGSTPGTPVINDKAFTSGIMSVLGSPVTVSFSSLGIRTNGGTGVQTIGVCDRYKRQYSVTIISSGKVNWSPNATGTSCP